MDRIFGTKTFLMEIYWRHRAYAIYERRTNLGQTCPDSVTVESIGDGQAFLGKHYSNVSDAIYAIEQSD
jgi:hypothetical protein